MSPDMIAAAQAAGLTADETRRVLDTLRKQQRTCHIEPTAEIGPGTQIWHFAVILQHATIGRDCSIGSGTEIGRGTTVGDRSRIGSHVFLPPNSRIGSDVFIGPGCTFTDDRHPKIHRVGDAPYHAEPPVIEDGANVGAGCVVLPGVHIRAGAVVGAGAIVTHDVAAGEHVRGEPARTRTLSAASAVHFSFTGVSA